MDYHGSAENIGRLLNRNNYFFVPFRQDNPITKPRSIVFDPSYIKKTLEYALEKEQVQPILWIKRENSKEFSLFYLWILGVFSLLF